MYNFIFYSSRLTRSEARLFVIWWGDRFKAASAERAHRSSLASKDRVVASAREEVGKNGGRRDVEREEEESRSGCKRGIARALSRSAIP